MKRLFILFIVAAFLLAVPASHFILGKGHVPVNKVQVCHKGKTITVSKNALNAHINHGDCQLPACDFAEGEGHVFQTGDDCSALEDANSDGKCDITGRVNGTSPACPEGTF